MFTLSLHRLKYLHNNLMQQIKKIITEELQHRHTFSTDMWLLQQSTDRDNITDVHNGGTSKL